MGDEVIAVFGATGKTGKLLIPLALEKGYKVKALVRTPSKVEIQNDNLTLIDGDFTNSAAIEQTVKGVDYVISCAGAPAKLKVYPKDMMLNFVSILVPILEAESSVKVFLYQADSFSVTPGGSLPFAMRIVRPIIVPMIGIAQNIQDNEAVIRYLEENKPSSFSVIVTRPGQIIEKDEAMKVVASMAPTSKPITFKSLASFTLEAIKDESLFGQHPYCATSKG